MQRQAHAHAAGMCGHDSNPVTEKGKHPPCGGVSLFGASVHNVFDEIRMIPAAARIFQAFSSAHSISRKPRFTMKTKEDG
jgi:hypothetical protein